MTERVMAEIIRPTVAGMEAEGRPFRGVLYAGLMITEEGPKLIEYNVRFGDPECQVLCARLQSDLLPALLARSRRRLKNMSLRWHEDHALCVVMASKGYPGPYEKGPARSAGWSAPVRWTVSSSSMRVPRQGDNDWVLASGGRVLGVTARGATLAEAQASAYAAVDSIDWPEGFCRRDIGWRALAG